MKLNKINKWFTLVELMIVFTIIILLSISIYAPYNFYSNKAKLKVAKSEIAKTIYEARNMAIYWLDDWSSNKSVWVYFDKNNSKNSIKLYSYPYNYSWTKNNFSSASVKLIKEIKLQPWIQIDKIWWKDKALFYFQSISWTWTYYYGNPLTEFSNTKIGIEFFYKNWWENLKSKIEYYTKTNIVDY